MDINSREILSRSSEVLEKIITTGCLCDWQDDGKLCEVHALAEQWRIAEGEAMLVLEQTDRNVERLRVGLIAIAGMKTDEATDHAQLSALCIAIARTTLETFSGIAKAEGK